MLLLFFLVSFCLLFSLVYFMQQPTSSIKLRKSVLSLHNGLLHIGEAIRVGIFLFVSLSSTTLFNLPSGYVHVLYNFHLLLKILLLLMGGFLGRGKIVLYYLLFANTLFSLTSRCIHALYNFYLLWQLSLLFQSWFLWKRKILLLMGDIRYGVVPKKGFFIVL
jgi:hypothetical protein